MLFFLNLENRIEVGLDTDTDSGADTVPHTETDTVSDSDADMETDEDTGTDTNMDSESASAIDTDTEADTDTGADTNMVCPAGDIIYVDAAGNGDGTSWESAMGSLQDALRLASCCTPVQVWVAEGNYLPGTEPTDTFAIAPGTKLYGSFAGTETSTDERDVLAHPSILNGDILGDDEDGIGNTHQDNAHHVVTGAGTVTLDGFAIRGGNTMEDETWKATYGAGMVNRDCDGTLMVANCRFENNIAKYTNAAAMYNQNCAVEITNSIFENNQAPGSIETSQGTSGGAIYHTGAPLTITGCTFSSNSASDGGAIAADSGGPTVISETIFSGNRAEFGSAISANGKDLALQNCQFLNNSTTSGDVSYGNGGGLLLSAMSIHIDGCRFEGNRAGSGGGMRITGVDYSADARPEKGRYSSRI